MNIHEYVVLSEATLSSRLGPEADLLHAKAGLSTELGELEDIFKKGLFYPKEISTTHVAEEIGDSLWYLAIVIRKIKGAWLDTDGEFLLSQQYSMSNFWASEDKDRENRLILEYLEESWNSLQSLKRSLDSWEKGNLKNPIMLGQVQFYLDRLWNILRHYRLDPEKVMTANLAKLYDRYGAKFDSYRANHRDLIKELEVMNAALADKKNQKA